MAFNMTKYVDADTHECPVELPGTDEVLTVGYRPRKLSTAALAKAEREHRDGLELAPRDGLVDTLAQILAYWDATMTDEAGEDVELPLTRETLNALPDQLLALILERVLNDAPKASAPKRRR